MHFPESYFPRDFIKKKSSKSEGVTRSTKTKFIAQKPLRLKTTTDPYYNHKFFCGHIKTKGYSEHSDLFTDTS